jgi:hypothetical protein
VLQKLKKLKIRDKARFKKKVLLVLYCRMVIGRCQEIECHIDV